MKIAIVEDNQKDRNKLGEYIEITAGRLNEKVIIDVFSNGLEFIDKFAGGYDLIYLDIEMRLMDGMTTAKKIRGLDSEVLLVFVTNHAQVAIQGYSVKATDFLLKPLNHFTFEEHFKKIVKIYANRDASILLKVQGKYNKINQNTIKYVKSKGHYLDFVTTDRNLTVLESMKNIENVLSQQMFYRCSNSHIINLNFVEGIEKDLVRVDQALIPISRSRKKDFMNSFTTYVGKQML